MRALEAYLLYGIPYAGPVALLVIAGLAIRWSVLTLAIVLWVRWVFFVELHNRDDAQHMFLVSFGSLVFAWRSGIGRTALCAVLRIWLGIEPRAGRLMDILRALLGQPQRQWTVKPLEVAGRGLALLRGVPWKVDDSVLSIMEGAIRREEQRLASEVIHEAPKQRLRERAEIVADRLQALLDAADAAVVAGADTEVLRTCGRTALEVLATLVKAGEVTGCQSPVERSVDTWRKALASRPSPPESAKWAVRMLDQIASAEGRAEELAVVVYGEWWRYQKERGAGCEPEEWLVRWRVAMFLIDAGFPSWANEITLSGQEFGEDTPQLCLLARARALEKLMPDERSALPVEIDQMRGALIDRLVDARVPELWRTSV